MIGIHALLVLAIFVASADSWAMMDGWRAERLGLPGAGIVSWAPVMGVGVYLLIVSLAKKAAKRFTRKATKWSIRIAAVPVGYVAGVTLAVACPYCQLTWYSQTIETVEFAPDGEFLPDSVVADFERRFDTPTVQYADCDGTYLLVPRDKFTESMVAFLQTRTAEAERAKNEECKEHGGPASS